MEFLKNMWGGNKEKASDVAGADIDRQLEKADSDFSQAVHSLKNGIALAPNDVTSADRVALSQLVDKAEGQGLDGGALRNFILGIEPTVAVEAEAEESENMNLTTFEGLYELYTTNPGVAPLFEKVRVGDMTVEELQVQLDDAGYISDENFARYMAQVIDQSNPQKVMAAE